MTVNQTTFQIVTAANSPKLNSFDNDILLDRYKRCKNRVDSLEKGLVVSIVLKDSYIKAKSKLRGFEMALDCLGIEVVEVKGGEVNE